MIEDGYSLLYNYERLDFLDGSIYLYPIGFGLFGIEIRANLWRGTSNSSGVDPISEEYIHRYFGEDLHYSRSKIYPHQQILSWMFLLNEKIRNPKGFLRSIRSGCVELIKQMCNEYEDQEQILDQEDQREKICRKDNSHCCR